MTSFARGTLGVGLLLLRVTVTTNIVIVTYHYSVAYLGEAIPLAVALLSVLLLLGFLTCLSSCLAGLVTIAAVLTFGEAALVPIAAVAPLCLSLALVGPGGYSLDALVWGPRQITYPGK